MKHIVRVVYAFLFFPFVFYGMVAPITPGEGLCKIINRIGLEDDAINSKLSAFISREDVISSQLETIDSTVDVLEPQVLLIANEYDDTVSLTEDLVSTLDYIDQHGLSPYVDNRKVFVSVFGDQLLERRFDILNFSFLYNIAAINFTTATSGGASVVPSGGTVVLSSGVAGSSNVSLESKRRLRYRSGREGYCFFTAMFSASTPASTQWIGLFDSNNGSAVGFSGSSFALLLRRAGVDNIVTQVNFNLDPLDGTGPSGFVLNPARFNLFRIAYGWLGGATITYQILDQTGSWVSFHVIHWNNANTGPSYIDPILPMRAQIIKTGGGSPNLQLTSSSWSAGIAYRPPSSSARFFVAANSIPVTLPATTVETHLLTIRNKSTYLGFTNRTEIRLVFLDGGSTNDTVTTASMLFFKKNATVTGTGFTDVNTANSVMEFSVTGTYTAGTGITFVAFPTTTEGRRKGPIYLPLEDFDIYLLPGESLTVTASNLSGATSPSNAAICAVSWRERF